MRLGFFRLVSSSTHQSAGEEWMMLTMMTVNLICVREQAKEEHCVCECVCDKA